MAATDTHVTRELLGALFYMGSVPRLYNEEQLQLRESLEKAVRRVWVSCGTAAGQKDVHTEAEEAIALKGVTRQQPVKLQQTEKTVHAVVNCRVS
jgi:hypothetical protein